MNAFESLWRKFAKSKSYREEFVSAQVKKGIPFQIRALIKHQGITQEILAQRSGLKQGVVSRAANPEYGNLTLNTLIRIAAGFDVAFVGKFVPFSELGHWFTDLSDRPIRVKAFEEEDATGLLNVIVPKAKKKQLRVRNRMVARKNSPAPRKPAGGLVRDKLIQMPSSKASNQNEIAVAGTSNGVAYLNGKR